MAEVGDERVDGRGGCVCDFFVCVCWGFGGQFCLGGHVVFGLVVVVLQQTCRSVFIRGSCGAFGWICVLTWMMMIFLT